MTRIAGLILWTPWGTTSVPDGPPTTRAGREGAGRAAGAVLSDEHPASRAVTTAPATMTQAERMPGRLAPITTLPAMPRAPVPRALMHADLPRGKLPYIAGM